MTSRRRLCSATILLAASACGVAPEPDIYTLVAIPGPAMGGSPGLVEVRKPVLPSYLDREEILRTAAPGRLQPFPNARWGGPLPDMMASVLAENLGLRLSPRTVYAAVGGRSLPHDVVLELYLSSVEAVAAEGVRLTGQVTVLRSGRSRRPEPLVRPVQAAAEIRAAGPEGVVDAMSRSLAVLANAIAPLLAN